jgi:hypothetical protein
MVIRKLAPLVLTLAAACAPIQASQPRALPSNSAGLALQAEPFAVLCGTESVLLVTVRNPAEHPSNMIVLASDVRDWRWPGKYSYWFDAVGDGKLGGISSALVCSCSDRPCDEPCGGPDLEFPVPAGVGFTWPVPFEAENLSNGRLMMSVELEWREGELASPRTRSATLTIVLEADGDAGRCRKVRVNARAPG